MERGRERIPSLIAEEDRSHNTGRFWLNRGYKPVRIYVRTFASAPGRFPYPSWVMAFYYFVPGVLKEKIDTEATIRKNEHSSEEQE